MDYRSGLRIVEKEICPKCNREIGSDTNFCPNCGTKIKKITMVEDPVDESKTKKLFRIFSFYFALVSLVLCFIFTFCIGMNSYMNIYNYSIKSDTYYIYNFLKDVYSAFESTFLYDMDPEYLISLMLGLMIVGIFLIITIIVFISSVVNFIKSFYDKNCINKFMKKAVAAYFVYICFVLCFKWYLGYYGYEDSYSELGNVLNTPTIIGLFLTTIAIVASLVFYLPSKFKKFNKQYVINGIYTLLTLVLGVFAICLLSSSIIKFASEHDSYFNFGAYSVLTNLYLYSIDGSNTSEFYMYYVSSIFIIYVVFLLTITFMLQMFMRLKELLIDFGEETIIQKLIKIEIIVSGVLLIIIGILVIVLRNNITGYIFDSSDYDLLTPIATIICGIVIIVVTIVFRAISGGSRKEIDQQFNK